jgi:hypothetical protein
MSIRQNPILEALAGYPSRPTDVRAGELAMAWEARSRAEAETTRLNERLFALMHRRDAYRRAIDGATPDDDLLEVATAMAGVHVMERAIAAFRPNIDRGVRLAEDAVHRCRELAEEYHRLLDGIAKAEREGRPSEAREKLDRLRVLAGAPSDAV